jgi:hypothetical protein
MSENTAEAIDQEENYADFLFAGSDGSANAQVEEVDRGDFVEESAPTQVETTESAESKPEPEAEVAETGTETPEPEETTAESEETTDETTEEAVQEAQSERKDPIQIPKSRLDKEIARKKALQNQVEELQKRIQQQESGQPAEVTEFSFDPGDAPKQMFDKVLEGDLDSANQLFATMLQDAVKAGVQTATQNIDLRVQDQVRTVNRAQTEQEVAEELENTYDFFRSGSETYDQGLVDEVLAIRDGFIGRGYEPADAMRQAADYVVRVNRPEDMPQAQGAATAAREPVAQTRNPEAVEKNIAAANQQPPTLPKSSQGTKPPASVDINALSEDEFAALPQATLARLRGDFV